MASLALLDLTAVIVVQSVGGAAIDVEMVVHRSWKSDDCRMNRKERVYLGKVRCPVRIDRDGIDFRNNRRLYAEDPHLEQQRRVGSRSRERFTHLDPFGTDPRNHS